MSGRKDLFTGGIIYNPYPIGQYSISTISKRVFSTGIVKLDAAQSEW